MSNQLGKPHDPSTSFGLTLKNIKHAEFASQETHCFEATIYLHGKPAIKVENDGRGGADITMAARVNPLRISENQEMQSAKPQ